MNLQEIKPIKACDYFKKYTRPDLNFDTSDNELIAIAGSIFQKAFNNDNYWICGLKGYLTRYRKKLIITEKNHVNTN